MITKVLLTHTVCPQPTVLRTLGQSWKSAIEKLFLNLKQVIFFKKGMLLNQLKSFLFPH